MDESVQKQLAANAPVSVEHWVWRFDGFQAEAVMDERGFCGPCMGNYPQSRAECIAHHAIWSRGAPELLR